MLAYFPVPYQDELLYSMIARYALHTGQTNNQKAVLRDVFGTESAVAIPDLPSHLNLFTNKAAQVWQVTVNDMIKRYTLAPIYLPFLRPLQAKKIINSMRSSQGGSIHTRCGISATAVQQPLFFRYCPSCVNEQWGVLGEPYWQRNHQIPGIETCYEHQCELVSSSLNFHPKQKHLYQTAAATCVKRSPVRLGLTENEVRLLELFQELINLQDVTGHSAHQWSLFYQNLAAQHQLKAGSRIDHRGIRHLLLKDWFGTRYGIHFEGNPENSWLVHIFRKHRKSFHPLRHLMVCCSLLPNVSVKEIIKTVDRLPEDESSTSEVSVSGCGCSNTLIRKKRSNWLKLVKENKGCGITEIRSSNPGGSLYAWLYRNDHCWLMEHKPPRATNNSNHHSIDYSQWDCELLKAVKTIQFNYLKKNKRPRLSKTFFINQLPRSGSVEKHLKDLPQTSKWLKLNAESIEDYQLFRIEQAAKTLRLQNLPVKRWRLLRIAGIRFESVTVQIKNVIKRLEIARSID